MPQPVGVLEVDGIDAGTATGWSVLVKGRAVEVHDPDDLRRLSDLPLRYWAVGDKVHWVRIVPAEVTGRRIWNRAVRDLPGEVPHGAAAVAAADRC